MLTKSNGKLKIAHKLTLLKLALAVKFKVVTSVFMTSNNTMFLLSLPSQIRGVKVQV